VFSGTGGGYKTIVAGIRVTAGRCGPGDFAFETTAVATVIQRGDIGPRTSGDRRFLVGPDQGKLSLWAAHLRGAGPPKLPTRSRASGRLPQVFLPQLIGYWAGRGVFPFEPRLVAHVPAVRGSNARRGGRTSFFLPGATIKRYCYRRLSGHRGGDQTRCRLNHRAPWKNGGPPGVARAGRCGGSRFETDRPAARLRHGRDDEMDQAAVQAWPSLPPPPPSCRLGVSRASRGRQRPAASAEC